MMPYSKQYQEIRRRKTFKKALEIQQALLALFPAKNADQIRGMVSNCKNHIHYGRKLRPESIVVMEFLDTHRLNPRTVYRWLEYLKLPTDLILEIENGTLTKKHALKIHSNKQEKESISKQWRFLNESKKIIKEVLNYI